MTTWPLIGDEHHQHYGAGQLIFPEGEVGTEMFIVVDGRVSITAQGRPIDSLETGSIFGEMALVENRPRSATATAETDCTLLVLDRARFVALIQESPEFALDVMATMSSRLRWLMEEEVERQRMEEELKIGRQIQLSLIPRHCPELPGWEFAAYYQAAREVGGDFYDFVISPENPERLRLVIADVTGKGVPAALFMASARTTLRAESIAGHTAGATLTRANQVLLLDSRSPLFLSAFYAMLDGQTGALTFANAGHERPLWWRADKGQVEALEGHNIVLGMLAHVEYDQWTIQMVPGDSLVLYTDGVTEARDAAGGFFGDERLEEVVTSAASGRAAALLQAVVDAVGAFADETPPADDCTIVVLRRLGEASPVDEP